MRFREHLDLVAWVLDLSQRSKLLLDGSHVDESNQQVLATSLVVGAAGSGATEGLLANNSTSALAVDVEVTSSVSELLLSKSDNLTVASKDGTGKTVLRGAIDELTGLLEGIGSTVIVDVGGQDRAEKLSREELVSRVGSSIDGRVNIVALRRVILASNNQLEILVRLGLINGTRELVERSLVNDWSVEVIMLNRVTNGQRLDLGGHLLLEFSPLRLGDVESRSSTALLALVLEGTADSLLNGVVDVSGRVNQVEVLAASLADNSGVVAVSTLADAVANSLIQLSEYGSATSVVKSSKFLVLEDDLGDFDGVTGHELDHILGKTSLEQDLVNEPVGGNGKITRLPDNNVTQQSRSSREVTSDGSKVERADSIDETLKRSVLESVPDSRGVVHRLVVIELFSIVNVESEEISELSSRIDLSLPSVLALAEHGGGHDIVTVLGRDEIGSLEEDSSSIGKRERLPSRLGRKSSINGLGDISGGCGVVGGDGGSMVSGVDLLGNGRILDLIYRLAGRFSAILLLSDIPPCLQRRQEPREEASAGGC